ncbi:MAG: hypothetical protein LBU34_11725 [Planctomycetaceae bacterium]|nr:hypothetical protein [Planctomycetaceae bacterium]
MCITGGEAQRNRRITPTQNISPARDFKAIARRTVASVFADLSYALQGRYKPARRNAVG